MRRTRKRWLEVRGTLSDGDKREPIRALWCLGCNRAQPRRRSRRGRENGQALVEFAIVVPLFLMIVIGIIQFGSHSTSGSISSGSRTKEHAGPW